MRELPQIEFFQDRVDTMASLYNSCDVLVSASSTEGFGLPLLEGLAADMLVVAPNATGQKDFLNKKNSLLVDVKKIDADKRYQYWTPSAGATTYLPFKDDLAQQMLNAYHNYDKLKAEFGPERKRIIEKFTWKNAAKQIIEIADDRI
jgi:glycosyltransferase involved in cell wall biosynthesis